MAGPSAPPAADGEHILELAALAPLVARIEAMRASVGPIPAALLPEPGRPPGSPPRPLPSGRFTGERLLAPFDSVRMDPGWALDYVYHCDGISGGCLWYTRRSDTSPLADVDAFRERFGHRLDAHLPVFRYVDHLTIDRTAAGAFQFAALALVAGQIYLYWHSGSNDLRWLLSDADRDRALAGVESLPEPAPAVPGGAAVTSAPLPPPMPPARGISAADRARVRALDLRPRVTIDGGRAAVTCIAFTRFGGFRRTTTEFTWPMDAARASGPQPSGSSRLAKLPSRGIATRTRVETIVSYDCGIRF